MPSDNTPPLLQVVKGAPTDGDLAALVAVFTALAAGTNADGPTKPADHWAQDTTAHRGSPTSPPYAFPYISALRA